MATEEEAHQTGLESKEKLRWVQSTSGKIDIEEQDAIEKVVQVWENWKPPQSLQNTGT